MENKIIYDSSIDQGLIKSLKVAVIGFGSQGHAHSLNLHESGIDITVGLREDSESFKRAQDMGCLLYTSPSPRDATLSRMPSSA